MPGQTRKKKGGNNLQKLENAIQQQEGGELDLENDNKVRKGGEMNDVEQNLNLDNKDMDGGELNELDEHNTNNTNNNKDFEGGQNVETVEVENNSQGFLNNGFP